MLHVLAYITAKPGMRETVLREFQANMPAVHAEEGCIEYVPVVDLLAFGPSQTELGPDTFVAVEKWASPEALKAYAAAPHMQACTERTANMIETRVIHVLSLSKILPDESRCDCTAYRSATRQNLCDIAPAAGALL